MADGVNVVEQLKADLHDQPANPLRPNQIQGYQDELQHLGVQLSGRDLDGRDALDGARGDAWLKGVKGSAQRRVRQIRSILDAQAPKKITGERANRIHAKLKEVEGMIRDAMLPRSAMRRNVPGAVGHMLRTEFNPTFKDAVLTWKRGRRALDPDNPDPDFTNAELLRPEGLNPDGTSTFRADAQIRGVFAQTPRAKENWPLPEPETTALAQARAREAEAATPTRRAPKPKKAKRVLTEEQKQALRDRLANARAAQAAKREAEAQTA